MQIRQRQKLDNNKKNTSNISATCPAGSCPSNIFRSTYEKLALATMKIQNNNKNNKKISKIIKATTTQPNCRLSATSARASVRSRKPADAQATVASRRWVGELANRETWETWDLWDFVLMLPHLLLSVWPVSPMCFVTL